MRKKLIVRIAALLTLVIIGMGALAFYVGRTIADRQMDLQLESLNKALEVAYIREKPEDSQAFFEAYVEDGHVRYTLIDASGSVLADTQADAEELGNHHQRPEVQAAFADGVGVAERFSATRLATYRYYARKLVTGEVLRLSIPVDTLFHYSGDLFLYIIYSILLALGLGVLFSWLLTRWISRPIDGWVQWAQAVVEQPDNPPPPPQKGGAMEPLERMGKQFQRTIQALSAANQQMDDVLAGMASGLIAVDGQHRIVWLNKEAESLFRFTKDVRGMDVVLATQQRMLTEALRSGAIADLSIEGAEYLSHASPMEDGQLLWFYQASDARVLELQRKEFASNVSHELKTPLMAIQGAVDAIRAHPDSVDSELMHIEGEVRWLNVLTRDLLTLTQVETMKSDVEMESIALKDVFTDVERTLRASLQEGGVRLELDIPDYTIYANYTRIRQLIGNLVENAIRYNRPDGRVWVQANVDEGQLVLAIKDTGIGIPDADKERIFERFYRVDRSRSRLSGGTGLGLSIVKHIVRLYSGTMRVESSSEGTAFIVKLPIMGEEEEYV